MNIENSNLNEWDDNTGKETNPTHNSENWSKQPANEEDVIPNQDEDDESSNEEEENTSNSLPEFNNKRIILQRFTIYNSLTTMYIVGSNAKESLFRILEIGKDQSNEDQLVILEDKSYFYTRKDMVELLNGLDESIEAGIHKIAQGYGLLGFIKFTKGYYLSIITKCSQVAVLGGHYMYHIDETKLIPLDFNYRRPEKYSDEERLLSIFKYLDLGKTFYFSYAYDITNSLQTNFMRNKRAATEYKFAKDNIKLKNNENFNTFEHNERFVWNNMLLKPVLQNSDTAAYEWFQPIIHGFIDQAKISVYGKKFYITIIARRSHHFAGARFLKRGVNDRGNVANEIETEQIVSDMLTSSFHDPKFGFYNNARYTSFIQHRGSIPLYWTQDLNKLPKPPIEINLSDPFYQSSALHFNNLFQRYGPPIIILNLIKTKEKQPRESRLNQHFANCIKYLNQFLSEEHKLRFHSFDMSRHSKKNLDVIGPLQKIASHSIREIGYFHNGHNLASTKLQKGIIRTNCIDCLDRTNAAQFIICKEALTHQLEGLGLIPKDKTLNYDSDLINILTEIFHDHGDTIAVQYGGSNLVNTMDSYRRINQWSSHTRDILNSVKRIYSNSFIDSIRQEAINLFLGNYVYAPDKPKLWELENDFYLHNEMTIDNIRIKTSYVQWFNKFYLSNSRFSFKDDLFINHNMYWDPEWRLEPFPDCNDNWFNECYVPRKFQSLSEVFSYNMNSNARYFPSNSNQPGNVFDYSPFESRKSKQEEQYAFSKPKSGESNIRYLDGCFEDDVNHFQGEKNYEEKKIGARIENRDFMHESAYLQMTNPNKLKRFLTNKIEKFAYNGKNTNQESAENYEDSSSLQILKIGEGFELRSLKPMFEPIFNEQDYELYQSQIEIPRLITTISKSSYDKKPNDYALSSDNEEIYKYFSAVITNTISSEDITSSQLPYLRTEDFKLYSKYTRMEEDRYLHLNTEDDYFK
ncbi:hypothetical protein G9P44_004636 [Scheffersomyces stipitis]|nr:hypothetical protein G9P44_004636 [Scheffersomyces stipitis]